MVKATSTTDKKYIFDLRTKLIFFCRIHDLSDADTARVFNTSRSSIHKTMKRKKVAFREFVKNYSQKMELIGF